MKKIFLILIICTSIILVNKEEYIIPNESIRLRIIPNSNSSVDILMKEKTIQEVNKVISSFDIDTIGTVRESITNSIQQIENKINILYANNNYDMSYNIKYGINEFPEKEYRNVKYKSGNYESLIIEIGEAKGNNYWCVLYPPLCMIDENIPDKEYKSKIVELFKKYF